IHPFLDGNGRIGRLLITLHLINAKILSRPVLYLSDFFERNRKDYIDALEWARTKNDIDHWILFFLSGLEETARKGVETLRKVIALHKKYDQIIMEGMGIRRRTHGHALLPHLFRAPRMQVNDIAAALSVTFPTANVIAEEMVKLGMLKETTGQKKNRIFSLHEYVDLFDSSPSP
ncbi:MAG TPA: Fic family protein, partial [Candidatus Nanoarchaeia archaeon]|nr:Fic family protein [Candidatus Nanoarchaeia archaeon]